MRIGAAISGFEQYLLQQLATANDAAITHAVRLSTGQQINRPSDAPAKFVDVSSFEHRLNQVQATKQQVAVAANMGSEVQLVVDEIRDQLTTIREALAEDEEGLLTADERASNQTTIDIALTTIDELARTEVGGRRWLDGSTNFRFAGRNSSQIREVQVLATSTTAVSGAVHAAATQAELTYTGATGDIVADASFALTGQRGSVVFDVNAGDALTELRDEINSASHLTGVTASVSGNDLTFTTVDYGRNASLSVNVASGTFAVSDGGQAVGTDAEVEINGEMLDAGLLSGNTVSYNRNGLRLRLELVAGYQGNLDAFTIEDGTAAEFALTPDLARPTKLGLSSLVSAAFVGSSGRLDQLMTGGDLSGLGDNTSQGIRVVDEALRRLTVIEGQIDAFADITIASAETMLESLEDNLEDTLDTLNGIDEDEENLLVAKNQTLGANALAALSLVQQQQMSLLSIVYRVAGLA